MMVYIHINQLQAKWAHETSIRARKDPRNDAQLSHTVITYGTRITSHVEVEIKSGKWKEETRLRNKQGIKGGKAQEKDDPVQVEGSTKLRKKNKKATLPRNGGCVKQYENLAAKG